MKIKILAMIEREIEVDDKFAPLAHNHPQHISYPSNSNLMQELDNEIFRCQGFRLVDEKGLSANIPKITNIDTENGGTIFEY